MTTVTLEQIHSPADLRTLDRRELKELAVQLREFVLPYDIVRESSAPDDTLLEFLQSTYEAAADLAAAGVSRAISVR